MIFVDAHVHIHACFDLKTLFDSARANFREEAAREKNEHDFLAALLLTESREANWFHHLASLADDGLYSKNSLRGWTIHRTDEDCSLWVEPDEGRGMFIIAGRQIITAEDLEVLALVTHRKFKDGLPLRKVIQNVKENGAIPVIPWGFGKWSGRRGKILERTLKESKNGELFLGDNGGRPAFWRRPPHFSLAETKGILILPGSDPLPLASESKRPGSFGFWVEKPIDCQKPARDMKKILLDSTVRVKPYGALERPYRFVRNQATMQILKRKRRHSLGN